MFIQLTELVVATGGELHFQLVVHIPGARDAIRDFTDGTLFLCGVNRPAQGEPVINGDDLHVRPPNLRRTEPQAPRMAVPMTTDGAFEFAPFPLKLCRAKAGQPELPEPSPARRSEHTPNSGCAAR